MFCLWSLLVLGWWSKYLQVSSGFWVSQENTQWLKQTLILNEWDLQSGSARCQLNVIGYSWNMLRMWRHVEMSDSSFFFLYLKWNLKYKFTFKSPCSSSNRYNSQCIRAQSGSNRRVIHNMNYSYTPQQLQQSFSSNNSSKKKKLITDLPYSFHLPTKSTWQIMALEIGHQQGQKHSASV